MNTLLHLEPCKVMFKSDFRHEGSLDYNVIFAFNFCNGKKMNCALMFIIRNSYERKCLTNLFHLERSNVMYIVISDIMAQQY